MKIGSAEGTPEEIKNLLMNEGLDLRAFLQEPEKPLGRRWLMAPCAIVAAAAAALIVWPDPCKAHSLLFLAGACGACWLAASVQIRFRNALATSVVGLGLLIVLLVAAGFLEPKETLEAVKVLKDKP